MTFCFILPACLRQAAGLGVNVGGMGLGVKVTVALGGGGVTVWAGTLSFGVEQAESPKRSVGAAISKMA